MWKIVLTQENFKAEQQHLFSHINQHQRQQLYARLPKQQQLEALQLNYDRCALVGNASDLLDINQGNTIDQCLTFRMNNYKIKGYESAAGSRCDVLFLNHPSTVKHCMINTTSAKCIVLSDPASFKQALLDYLVVDFNNKLVTLIRPSVHKAAVALFKSQISGVSNPSIGWYVTNSIINLSKTVKLFGFGITGGCSHYFYKEDSHAIKGQRCRNKGYCCIGSFKCDGGMPPSKGKNLYHGIDTEQYLRVELWKQRKIEFPGYTPNEILTSQKARYQLVKERLKIR